MTNHDPSPSDTPPQHGEPAGIPELVEEGLSGDHALPTAIAAPLVEAAKAGTLADSMTRGERRDLAGALVAPIVGEDGDDDD